MEKEFPYNPDHACGTCSKCGKEMAYNVPRMGPNGGFVHKETGSYLCGEDMPKAPGIAYILTPE